MRRVLVVIGLVISGCGSSSAVDAGEPLDAGETAYIALTRDFQGYEDWQQYVIHDPGSTIWDRIVWINHLPPHGASAFPVGTIIVRRFPDPTSPTGFTQHAMVKRGGGFNAQGAVGWEWFEISDDDGGAYIDWRGSDQPDSGTTYNASGQTCNQCHVGAAANDFVESAPLQLSGF